MRVWLSKHLRGGFKSGAGAWHAYLWCMIAASRLPLPGVRPIPANWFIPTNGHAMANAPGSQTSPNQSSRAFPVLRGIAYLISGFVVLLALVGAAAFVSPPGWLAREFVTLLVHEKTGRALQVDGEAVLTLRPDIRLRLGKVSLSGPPGATEAKPFVAERVEIAVGIVDLWSWQFDVPEIILEKPQLNLRKGEPLFVRIADGGVRAGGIPQKISVSGGVVEIEAAPPAAVVRLDDVDGEMLRTAGENGVAVKGSLKADAGPVSFNGTIGDLFAVAEGKASEVDLTLETDFLEVRIDGEAATQPIGQFTGAVKAASSDLKRLLELAQIDAGEANLGNNAALEGMIAGSLKRISLNPAKLTLDSLSGVLLGELALEGERPSLKAKATSASLDIDTLLPSSARKTSFGLEAGENDMVIPTPWESLVAALDGRGPDEPGKRGAVLELAGGWSSEPFALEQFPNMDVALSVEADEIKYKGLPLRNGRLELKSDPRRLEVLLDRIELYEGSASGRIDLTISEGPLATRLQLELNRLSLDPFVLELLKKRVLSGTGNVKLTVAGKGGSMRELVGSLDGSATMQAEKGAIIGYDLRRAIETLSFPQSYNAGNKTRFEKLKGSYAVRTGVLNSTEDLTITGPDVDITSRGYLGLVSGTIDQRINLSLSPPPWFLPIPVRLSGTVEKPDFGWDLFKAISEPSRFATPFAIAPSDEKMPAEVRRAIELALQSEDSEKRIAPDARRFLEDLLATR